MNLNRIRQNISRITVYQNKKYIPKYGTLNVDHNLKNIKYKDNPLTCLKTNSMT